jgi:hypothetical protein
MSEKVLHTIASTNASDEILKWEGFSLEIARHELCRGAEGRQKHYRKRFVARSLALLQNG